MSMSPQSDPPVATYELVLKVTGNTHQEIQEELYAFAHGGYLIHSDYEKRDTFTVYGGRFSAQLKHVNPLMSPERYKMLMHTWAENRKKRDV